MYQCTLYILTIVNIYCTVEQVKKVWMLAAVNLNTAAHLRHWLNNLQVLLPCLINHCRRRCLPTQRPPPQSWHAASSRVPQTQYAQLLVDILIF